MGIALSVSIAWGLELFILNFKISNCCDDDHDHCELFIRILVNSVIFVGSLFPFEISYSKGTLENFYATLVVLIGYSAGQLCALAFKSLN